jgi:uncharacterized protein (TIGR00303 family)
LNLNPIDAFDRGFIRAVTNDELCRAFLTKLAGIPSFSCVVGSTATAGIPDISAAGETPEKRRYTAALDAEFLVHGKPLSLPDIPKNPLGPPSPVVITKAALELLGIEALIVDAGSTVKAKTPRLELGLAPGDCITSGQALTLPENFAQRCRAAGRQMIRSGSWAVIAESVPGGTTTALSVLEALGIDARGKVSSSMPGGNHELKQEVVAKALKAAALPPDATALQIAAAVGDPMQPALALMALEASLTAPVVLGGGTQMAAVAALMARMVAEGEAGDLDNVAIATTRWVAVDTSADLAAIIHQITPQIAAFAAWLDFSESRLPMLRHYEKGLVKEGVGAGAAAFAALAVCTTSPDSMTSGGSGNNGLGLTTDQLVRSIEEIAEKIP